MKEIQRGLAVYEAAGEKDGVDAMDALEILGECHLKAKDFARARAVLERALSIATARPADVNPSSVAAIHFMLAEVLWPSPAERGRALELAKQARDQFAKAPPKDKPRLAEVEAWLQTHAARGP
jgi:hypothetical protein